MKALLFLALMVPGLLSAGQATVSDSSSTTRTTRTTRTTTVRSFPAPRGEVVWVQPAPATYHVGDYVDPCTKRVFHEAHRIHVREVGGHWARVTFPVSGARSVSAGYAAQRERLQRQELEGELARQRAETRVIQKAAIEFQAAQREFVDKAAEFAAAAKKATPAQMEKLRAELEELRARVSALDKTPRTITPPGATEPK